MDLIDKAGVSVLLHAFASDVLMESAWTGVVFETKSGPIVIRAKVICDCTGDGDVVAAAGAKYHVGRQDHLTQPATLLFRVGEFDADEFRRYILTHPEDWNGVFGLRRLVEKVYKGHEQDFPREDLLFFGTPHEGEVTVNSTRVLNVDGTNVFNLTCAEWEGRRQMETVANFMREHVPGFKGSYVIQTGVSICIRETRRIQGEYMLTEEDVVSARRFKDVVARCSYPIDIHNPEGKGTLIKNVPAQEAYDIPLRCLLPQGLDHMLIAGRCISGTHIAHSSYRVMPISMATGHAAGVCAALAAEEGVPVHTVHAEKVQRELLEQGAILDLPL
jgi:hypothetical protein